MTHSSRSPVMSRADLSFLLHDWLKVDDLTERPVYAEHDRESLADALSLAETIATRELAPINRLIDRDEPFVDADGSAVTPAALRDALSAYAGSGLAASTFAAELGGAQLPVVVKTACSAWLQAASAGAFAYAFLAESCAALLVTHGTPEQVALLAQPLIDGRFYGTMCLSEPGAGSSLADISTSARRQHDGTYRVHGTKMWISAGDHTMGENIVHLVLARTDAALSGTHGLSLFAVPKYLVNDDGSVGEPNDVALAGLNHKMGYRGTTNAVLGFGEGVHRPGGEPGAVGTLIGERGRGLAVMFHMMNEARIGVGLSAASLGYTAHLRSLDYARDRQQGRPHGSDGSSEPVAIIEHPDVRRMLVAQKSYVEGGLALVLYCARLVDEHRTHPDDGRRLAAKTLLDLLTPIAKSWPAQWCLRANDLAIQIHGGYGYARDHDVEQLYRDNRLNAIHEGTHGIQAIDLLGRKVLRDGAAALHDLLDEVRATADQATDRGSTTADWAKQLTARVQLLEQTTAALLTVDEAAALAHATPYLEALGHLVVSWLWLDQVLALGDRSDDFASGKWQAARYFYWMELPMIDPLLTAVQAVDPLLSEIDPTAW